MEKNKRSILVICICALMALLILGMAVLPGIISASARKNETSYPVGGPTRRAGSKALGYFDLPVSWDANPQGDKEKALMWNYEDGYGTIAIGVSFSGNITAEILAVDESESLEQMEYTDIAIKETYFADRQCLSVQGEYNGLYAISWIFESGDATHYISVDAPQEYFDDLVSLVRGSFSFKK